MSISLLRADKEIAEIFERQYRTVYRVCFSYMKSAADTESSSNVEITPMISSFGESTYSGDIAVVNGGIAFSDALEAALKNTETPFAIASCSSFSRTAYRSTLPGKLP